MADGVDFKMEGIEELNAKLKSISDDVKFKGGRFALRKAANLVRDAAKRNAAAIDDPQTAEKIAENVAVRWSGRTFKRTGNLAFRVGILGGSRKYANTRENVRKGRVGKEYSNAGPLIGLNPGGDTWYWRLVEFGTEKTRAQPFFQRALSDNASKATNEFVSEYKKAIDRAIKRAKKTGK